MANNYSQGYFAPENPSKYIGSNRPKYRSGWELTVMRFCDNHPAVIDNRLSRPVSRHMTGFPSNV